MTNDGFVYVAIKHYSAEITREAMREDGDRVPTYQYKLLSYGQGGSTGEITFDLQKQFILGTKIIYNKDQSLTVAGLYKAKPNGRVRGAFYTTLDRSGKELTSAKLVSFPEEIITLIDKDDFGKDKKSDPGISSRFKIRDILYRTNGSVDLISEFEDRYTVVDNTGGGFGTSISTGRMRSTTYYVSGSIISVNIPAQGEPRFTRIPKHQRMAEAQLFLGYFPIVYRDKLVIIYNDEEDNLERDLSKGAKLTSRFKRSSLVAAIIDSKGNLERRTIYNHRDEDYITLPRNTSKLTDNRYLVVSDLLKIFKRRTRFGVMEVK